MAIEKLSVILELVTGNYNRDARNAANATGQIGNSAKSVTGSLGAMIGPAAIGGAIIGFGKMALAAGENADRLFDLAAQTGLSTDELQRWEFVAKAAGATTEVFSDAVKAVIRNLDGTAGATGNAAKAYEALGISVKGANGELRDAGEITAEVFDKLAGMTNITERNALAQDIFGKKWEETISILDLGSEALGDLRAEGAKGVISAEALRNSDKFRETWQKFMAQVGPKLNEVLGKIAPALTEVAEGAIDVLEAMEPLIEVVGFLTDRYADLKGGLDGLEGSDNAFLEFLGTAGNMVVGFGGGLGALASGIGTLTEETAANVTVSNEVHDSWNAAAIAEQALLASLGPTITMLNNQYASHRNVAAAATAQRTALINLFTAQADLLDPVRSVILLMKESVEANKRLTEVQANSTSSAEDLALAVIEAEQAELRLNAAGAAMSADQIQAFAQLLVTELGYSEQAALDLLTQLGLFDGFVANVKVNFEVANASLLEAIGGTGINNTDVQVRAHGGPVRRGQPYLVGERGPELMIPSQSGTILPHGTAIGGGSVTINVQSPMQEFRSDLQYATILASVTNLVEAL